tara:strand:+ start:95 stop:235 length:141 start_codon:yes stop_codon:yes gene_type:complete
MSDIIAKHKPELTAEEKLEKIREVLGDQSAEFKLSDIRKILGGERE